MQIDILNQKVGKKYDSLNKIQGSWYLRIPETVIGCINPRFKKKILTEWNNDFNSEQKKQNFLTRITFSSSMNGMAKLNQDIDNFFNNKNKAIDTITIKEIWKIADKSWYTTKALLRGAIVGIGFSLLMHYMLEAPAFVSDSNICSFALSGILLRGMYLLYTKMNKFDTNTGKPISISFLDKASHFITKVFFPGSLIGSLLNLAMMYGFSSRSIELFSRSIELLSIFNIYNSILMGMSLCVLYAVYCNRDRNQSMKE